MAIYWFFAYIAGNFLTAWWVGKCNGIDLRKESSGNLGARNAGTVIGRNAFVLTFLGDAGKGTLIVALGHYAGFEEWAVAVAGLLVICGHLFPFWLKGRGGKGIAAFIGVSLSLAPFYFLIMFLVFIVFFPFIKSATLTMLISFSALIVAVSFSDEWSAYWPLIIAIFLIVLKHQANLKESFKKRFAKQ